MKNKIALASAFLAASSFSTAEIVINDFLSFEGFVDMSYSHVDGELADANESDNSFAIDQVEISWLFDFDPVTAQIDLQYEDLPGDDTVVEQAFATYHLDNGSAITAGRYASMLGFEAFEPTGLYQYSLAYDLQVPGFDIMLGGAMPVADGVGTVEIIPGYAQGVKYTYEADNTFFGLSLQDEVFDYDGDRLGGDDASSFGIEAAGSINFDNGLTYFLGGAYEDSDEAEGDSYMLNTYVTFETGAWIFAAELNYGESEADAFALGSLVSGNYLAGGSTMGEEEALQALLMANFAYSEKASITGRFSYVDHELDGDGFGGDVELEAFKYTLAHGYAFTDNLFLVNEISYVDGDAESSTLALDEDFESIQYAVELIFSF
ncbi:hypothetical protein DDZ13_00770 [Coraliomargarita sinensis]|uniref:Porin n=1 Tax=Coraliomargarita sinensis TaxID=2174842 RepID=A0A317ZMG4_9BACT|nr:outer membrane beta-barrel protein [Coraliomargarita sinensis]PXA05433.1 hypothetical protein DDZ13_00770 [Coraliomargarita sinensis]